MKTLSILIALALAGCASNAAPVTPSIRLKGPDAAVMVPAQSLPAPLPNEDAKALLRQCRAAYGAETDKLAPLQMFAKRVTQSKR